MGEPARAVQFSAPHSVEVIELELPELAPGEVLVHTARSGISSGTELLAYRGRIDPRLPLDEGLGALAGTFAFPFRYGYACVGHVAASRSANIAEGSLVFAFHPHQDRFVAAEADLVVLADAAPRHATLLPFVETALQVCLDAGAVSHEPVLVTGLGALGVLVALLLERSGAAVIAAEPIRVRRDLGASLGIRALDPAAAAAALSSETGERGVPLVIEASGNPRALARALDLLAHEGTALVASWYGDAVAELPLGGAFHRRRLSIRSTQVSSVPAAQLSRWSTARRRATARDLLAELPLAALATHELPFDEVDEAFALLDRGEDDVLHVALCYE